MNIKCFPHWETQNFNCLRVYIIVEQDYGYRFNKLNVWVIGHG